MLPGTVTQSLFISDGDVDRALTGAVKLVFSYRPACSLTQKVR